MSANPATRPESARAQALRDGLLRDEFPIFEQPARGKRLVYLDTAASAQKPQAVLDVLARFYSRDYANIHRGVYELSERATAIYESARRTVARFVGAARTDEIVFVRGTTEAINLVAHSFARPRLSQGDEVLVTEMEHHSNIVPWQLVCSQTGARVRKVPVLDNGELDLETLRSLLSPRTRLLAVTHVSNTLGTVNPLEEIVAMARSHGVPVVVDGAQATAHLPVNVEELGCDFYAFSGHKLYGPTGTGALFGKAEHLAEMPPFQGGGDMIASVTFEKTTFAEPPRCFEAGTPDIAGAAGLSAAIDYVEEIGLDAIQAHDERLLQYATPLLSEIRGLRLVGTAPRKSGVLSFVLDNAHPHDVATVLDMHGVAVRAGHHCTQPLMERFGIPATTRASFGVYNTEEDVDRLIHALADVEKVFS